MRTCPYCAMVIPPDATTCPQCERDLSGRGAFQGMGYRAGAQASLSLGVLALALAGYGATRAEWIAVVSCGVVGLLLLGTGVRLIRRVRDET